MNLIKFPFFSFFFHFVGDMDFSTKSKVTSCECSVVELNSSSMLSHGWRGGGACKIILPNTVFITFPTLAEYLGTQVLSQFLAQLSGSDFST